MQTRTVREVAAILRVSVATVYMLCAQRRLPHIRVGAGRGTIRILQEDLDAFIAGATVRPEEPATPSLPTTELKHIKL